MFSGNTALHGITFTGAKKLCVVLEIVYVHFWEPVFKWFDVTKDGNSYVLIRIILAKVYRDTFIIINIIYC